MFLAFALVAGWANRDKIVLKIKSVYASVPPKAAQTPPASARSAHAFFGDAPWAMSALPECFSQLSKTTGPQSYVLAHLPSGMRMLSSGAGYRAGDCALQVKGDAIFVQRGRDRLRIPPVSRLYVAPGKAALLRGGFGGLELRVYDAAPATTT